MHLTEFEKARFSAEDDSSLLKVTSGQRWAVEEGRRGGGGGGGVSSSYWLGRGDESGLSLKKP